MFGKLVVDDHWQLTDEEHDKDPEEEGFRELRHKELDGLLFSETDRTANFISPRTLTNQSQLANKSCGDLNLLILLFRF